MRLLRIAGLLLSLASIALPASASAQAKLKITGQQARSKGVEVTAEQLSWEVQVRDICTTQVLSLIHI